MECPSVAQAQHQATGRQDRRISSPLLGTEAAPASAPGKDHDGAGNEQTDGRGNRRQVPGGL